MPNQKQRTLFSVTLVAATMLTCASFAVGQSPTPAPTVNPAQRDATRPPGSERNTTVPPEARPNTQNPAAPPASQQAPAQAPPGTQQAPPTAAPGTQPSTVPGARPIPHSSPTPTDPDLATGEPKAPVLPPLQQRPVPPVPDMTRLGVVASQQLPLSLNDAIKRALENNNDIEVARDDVRFAETQLRSLEGIFDPIFLMQPTYDKRISPEQSSLSGAGSGGTTSSTTYSWDPSVTKQFGRGGGNYTITFANNHTNTSNSFSLLNPFYSSNLSLQFVQPLWRNRSIDNNRRQIRIQRKRVEQSDADFRLRTIDVITRVQQAYWELVFALRDQQNQLDNLNLTRENLRNVEAQIGVGAKAPLERAEVLTELANRESALLIAVQAVSFAENILKQLMFKDSANAEWFAQVTPTDNPTFDERPVNLNEALKEARENRPELRRLRLEEDINKVDLQYFKNQTRPQIDLVSTLATTGLAGKDVSGALPPGTLVPIIGGTPDTNSSAFLLQQIRDIQVRAGFPQAVVPLVPTAGGPPPDLIGGYAKDLGNLFGFKTRNVTVGVAIQIPFKNKTAEANYAGARVQQNQIDAVMRSQEQVVEVDVRNAAQAVETSRRRVLAARDARTNAELQFEGEQRLYQVGRSTTFLLFQRQNALTNARAAELRAQTDYNKALADLQRATSTTLRSNNIVVDSPTP